MDFLTSWIQNIILVVLFANIIDLILPAEKTGRYVRVVISFIIMLAILNPILSIFEQDLYQIDSSFVEEERPSFAEIVADGESLRNESDINKKYKNSLKKQIKALVNLHKDVEEIEVQIALSKKQEIDQLVIKVTKGKVNREKIKDLIKAFYMIDKENIKVKIFDRGD